MATKDLNMKELRFQLKQRGLSTAGIKSVLVDRLEADIREKNMKSADADRYTLSLCKRQRDSDNNDTNSEAPVKIKATDELRSTNVKLYRVTKYVKVEELQAQLARRGLSTAGIKPVLVRRLNAYIQGNSEKLADADGCTRSSSKRQGDSDNNDADSEEPVKIKNTDESQSVNVKHFRATKDLQVEELRAQLAQRGLSTAGIKAALVWRLDCDNRKRSKKPVRGVSAAGTKKKVLEGLCADDNRDSGEKDIGDILVVNEETKQENANPQHKVKAIDDLQKMNIKQLREEATKGGISAAGTKKELLDRLSADNDNVSSDNNPVKEEKEEKIVTAMKKGSAVLDKWLPDHIKAQYHVLQIGDEIYDAMLNQTNTGENNNKFLVIQVLESDDGGKFMVYFRWGRVGLKGQRRLYGPYTSQQAAISEFEKKFFDKARNHWSNRREFASHPFSFSSVEMDYSGTKSKPPVQQKLKSKITLEPQESKLEARIAKFISLICNMSMMGQQIVETGYSAEKLPLGKLSKSTILKGYDVLKRIADAIGQADRFTLEELSREFYTVFPHDFGFSKASLFIIDTPRRLKSKLDMVEALGEIEVAMKLMGDDADMEDPLYSRYRRLHCELTPLEVHSEEFSMIEKYTKNTRTKTRSGYDVDIIQIFKVSREGEAERFEKFSGTKNRMLLWHGSRLTNWTGILSQGLRIPPPEAPVTGYMYGKGVYFADMFSKAAKYCCSSRAATAGVLLLCEVALGDMAELLTANFHADKLPAGKLSTKGVGVRAPALSEALTLEDGVIVPFGRPKEQPGPKGSLLYNKYIVYNMDQIIMRYVVHVNFKFK